MINFDNPQSESFDVEILEEIKYKIEGLVELILDEQKFLNGIIRKLRPKKIVEIGVCLWWLFCHNFKFNKEY